MKFTLAEALEATRGAVAGAVDKNLMFEGLSTDSRGAIAGKLFLALRGERFDGHDFIDKAIENGAAGLVTSKEAVEKNVPNISVDDTLAALGLLGRMARRKGGGEKVLGTLGNLNNLIGLPLTLLGADGDEKLAVVELGISEPGEMERLTRICEPDVALITGVGEAHTEGLGDVAGVAKEKFRIVEGLKEGGVLILPHGDRHLGELALAKDGEVRMVTFGWEEGADYRGDDYRSLGAKGCTFKVNGRPITLLQTGKHNATNAIGAWALAHEMGAAIPVGETPFGDKPQTGLRGAIRKGPNGSHLLVDCYNANPEAVAAAIDNLAELAADSRKVIVLGEMRELGNLSEGAHLRIGGYATEKGVEKIYLTGEEARPVAEGATDAGLGREEIIYSDTLKDIADKLGNDLKPGDWVLIKGSRANNLDKLVEMVAEG